MKQLPGSSNCVAVVGAMAAGTSVEEFEKFALPEKAPYSDLTFYKWMVAHGYGVGIGVGSVKDKVIGIENDTTHLCAEFRIEQYSAYVIVKSFTRPDGTHAVYWDGKKICDPNPDVEDGLPFEEYEILDWFPIYIIDERLSEKK